MGRTALLSKDGTYKEKLINQDYDQAAKWYRAAAEQGMVAAQVSLGVFYAAGLGVGQDNIQAYKWLALGEAAALPASDMQRLAAGTKNQVATSMTPTQITTAQYEVSVWLAAHRKDSR